MSDDELIKKIDIVAKGYQAERIFLQKMRESIFKDRSHNTVEKSLIIVELHNRIEKILDRILRNYIRPMKTDLRGIYDEDIRVGIKARLEPEEVRNRIIFKYPFFDKKTLVLKLLPLSKRTRNVLDAITMIRNGIVHKYNPDDVRFNYRESNVLSDSKSFMVFGNDLLQAINEIQEMDTKLLDVIDKSESELS